MSFWSIFFGSVSFLGLCSIGWIVGRKIFKSKRVKNSPYVIKDEDGEEIYLGI
jgi:hypothetical protein